MSKYTQKEAVFNAVVNICGEIDGIYSPSKEQRAMINAIICEGFKNGTVELSTEYATDAELKSYTSGLISNWLRKDTRLNGGTKYVAKNPGSRAGSGDAQLKAMRALMSTLTTPEDKAEVQKHIDARVAEIASAKQVKTVDFSALPADLQAKFNK